MYIYIYIYIYIYNMYIVAPVGGGQLAAGAAGRPDRDPHLGDMLARARGGCRNNSNNNST